LIDPLHVDFQGEQTMATASLRGSRWGRRLLQGAGLLVLSGILGGLVSLATAQDTKKPAKTVAPGQKVISDIVVAVSGIDQVSYINEEIEKKWKENKIGPSDRCSDYEFIRRASLDIMGRIATGKGAAEARYGRKAKQPTRRQAKGRCLFGSLHTTEGN